MPARAGNFARTFRRTFRRRLWQHGPTRNGGGSSSPWETHSGLCRFSGTGFRKNHFFDYRRDTNAGRRPPLAVSCRGRHRLWDAGDCVSISRRKKISPRTDLDDRPRLGGKTPSSPGRRVPVDSPEDRRFSRSKSPPLSARHRNFARTFRRTFRRRLWRQGPTRYSPTGFRKNRVNAGVAATLEFLSMYHQHIGQNRVANAGTRRKLRTDVPTDVPRRLWRQGPIRYDAPTGFRKNRVNCGSSCDSRISVYVSSDFHIGQNRVANAGTRRKLRTDVPTDVPTPAMAARSDSERWGKLLTVGDALRTLPFFWYGISQKSLFRLPARHKRRQETAACGLVQGPAPAMGRRLRLDISKKKNFSSPTSTRPRLEDPALARASVPVDSPEDRRFSNRSKSHRRCRHAIETSHGRSDGRSDAGYGGRVRLGTAGDAPTGFRKNRVNCGSSCDSRISVYVSSDFHIGQNRVANAGTRRKLRTDVPTDVPTPAMAAGSDSVRRGMLLRDFAKIG